MPNVPKLLDVLRTVHGLLANPKNDFTWSSWEGTEDALAEVDEHIQALEADDLTRLRWLLVLFAPTGPLHEVSLSSGWSDKYAELANRFDDALAESTCACIVDHSAPLRQEEFLGSDSKFGESFIESCTLCGRLWLRYLYELESETASGRWFDIPITSSERPAITATVALNLICSKPWHFYGGSFFGGKIGKTDQPPTL